MNQVVLRTSSHVTSPESRHRHGSTHCFQSIEPSSLSPLTCPTQSSCAVQCPQTLKFQQSRYLTRRKLPYLLCVASVDKTGLKTNPSLALSLQSRSLAEYDSMCVLGGNDICRLSPRNIVAVRSSLRIHRRSARIRILAPTPSSLIARGCCRFRRRAMRKETTQRKDLKISLE